jgi:hypothetical protein
MAACGNTGPASIIQRQFWVLHSLAPHSSAYNVPLISLIEGNLDVDALEQAINALFRRHSIFRAVFGIDDSGRLVQKIPDWQCYRLPVVDLRQRADPCNTDPVKDPAVIEEARRPFDLASGSPLRFKLYRIRKNSCLLAITAHHIVFDLATNELLAEELAEEYKAASTGIPRIDVPGRVEYAEYSKWQEKWLQGEVRKAMEEKWQRHLEGCEPALNLPSDRPNPAPSTSTGSVVPVRLDGNDWAKVGAFCKKESVTPFLVLLTAWALTLSRLSGQKRLCVGVPFTNRRKDEFRRTMGCFVNILPLTFDIYDAPSMREALRRVRMTMLQIHRMQEMPFYNLVQLMRRRRTSGESGLFQAGFTFAPPMQLRLEGLKVKPAYIHHGGSQLDLFATFWEEPEAIVGVIEYDVNRVEPALADRIAGTLLETVGALIDEPERAAT